MIAGAPSQSSRLNPTLSNGAVGYTAVDVADRIAEAVDTLKRLPEKGMQRNLTRWPEFVRASHEAYGYGDARLRRAPASPEAIGRLDETLGWLRLLPRDAQKILWCRANGLSWRRIAGFAGKSPNTCRAWYAAALQHIAETVSRGKEERLGEKTSTPPPP